MEKQDYFSKKIVQITGAISPSNPHITIESTEVDEEEYQTLSEPVIKIKAREYSTNQFYELRKNVLPMDYKLHKGFYRINYTGFCLPDNKEEFTAFVIEFLQGLFEDIFNTKQERMDIYDRIEEKYPAHYDSDRIYCGTGWD